MEPYDIVFSPILKITACALLGPRHITTPLDPSFEMAMLDLNPEFCMKDIS